MNVTKGCGWKISIQLTQCFRIDLTVTPTNRIHIECTSGRWDLTCSRNRCGLEQAFSSRSLTILATAALVISEIITTFSFEEGCTCAVRVEEEGEGREEKVDPLHCCGDSLVVYFILYDVVWTELCLLLDKGGYFMSFVVWCTPASEENDMGGIKVGSYHFCGNPPWNCFHNQEAPFVLSPMCQLAKKRPALCHLMYNMYM